MFGFARINNKDEWKEFVFKTKKAFHSYDDWREFFEVEPDSPSVDFKDYNGPIGLTPDKFPITAYFYTRYETSWYGDDNVQHIDWFYDDDDISVATFDKRCHDYEDN